MCPSERDPSKSTPLNVEKRSLVDWLVAPSATIQDLETRHRARLLTALILTGSILFFAAALAALNPAPFISYVLVGMSIYLLFAYRLSRTEHYKLAAVIGLGMEALIPLALLVASPDHSAFGVISTIIWIILTVLVCNILFSLRVTAIVAILNTLSFLLLAAFLNLTPDKIGVPLYFICVLSLVILIGAQHRNTIEKDRLFELDRANRELQALRSTLEERVRERTLELEKTNAALQAEIDEHKQAEEARRESESFYQSLVEILPQTLCRKDLEGRITFGNKNFCDSLDMSLAEVTGKTDLDLYPRELAEKYRRDDRMVAETGKTYDIVEEYIVPNGKKSYIQIVKTPVRGADDKITGVQMIYWDITDRKRAEDALKQAHEELEIRVKERTAELEKANEALKAEIAMRKQVEEKLDALNQISQQISKLGEPSEILELIFQAAGQALHSKDAYIALHDEATDQLIVPIKTIDGQRMPEYVRPFSPGLTEHVFLTREPLLADADTMDELARQGFRQIGPWAASLLAAPVIAGERVLAVIGVQDFHDGHAFTPEDVKLLSTFASQAAIALENANLFAAVQEELVVVRQAEEALRESEERFRILFESSPDGVVLIDPNAGLSPAMVECNDVFCRMAGYTKDELIGRPIDLINGVPRSAAEHASLREQIHRKSHTKFEWTHYRKDGTSFPVESSVTLITLGGRELILGIDRDITERKRIEEALRLQSTRLQIALEVASAVTTLIDIDQVLPNVADLIRKHFGYNHVGIFLIDASGHWAEMRADSSAKTGPDVRSGFKLEVDIPSMIGYAITHAQPRIAQDVAQDPLYLVHPQLQDTRSEAVFPLMIGNTVIGILDLESTQADVFTQDTVMVLKTMADQIAVAVQNARLHATVKERARELEQAYQTLQNNQEQLLVADKMASLGRLTAGIAHEMNTPLAAVRAALVELDKLTAEYHDSIADPDVTPQDHAAIAQEMHRSISIANSAAERAATFIRGIKTQTRDLAAADSRRFNAVPIIQETLILLSHALRKANCALHFDPAAPAVELFGSPGRLSQVVTNLVTNAIDACEPLGGGQIHLSLVAHRHAVELRVQDTGCGIPAENLSKIFDPMFTTKPFGKGTGLGLTIVHDIVTGEFGGKVEVSSQVGQGTVFILVFPKPQEFS